MHVGCRFRCKTVKLNTHWAYHKYLYACKQSSPLSFMVLCCSVSIPMPSRHTTTVPLRSTVAVTVAVDVMDPVITSVTVNWNGWLVITRPWSRRTSSQVMVNDGMFHWCPLEGIVHVNVTLSPGHCLSTLDWSWASVPKSEGKQLSKQHNPPPTAFLWLILKKKKKQLCTSNTLITPFTGYSGARWEHNVKNYGGNRLLMKHCHTRQELQ